jgi:putative spermidine/putrescine transport system ATP-binding protein
VFNHGRIEQVGTPAEVYEHPATAFVAGFVGTSNLFSGDAARQILGREGAFSVRPEKIHLGLSEAGLSDEDVAATDAISAPGRVAEVVYAGPTTRFVVDLDAGPRLVVVQQNQQTSSADVAALRDRTVRLSWRPEHVVAVPDRGGQ